MSTIIIITPPPKDPPALEEPGALKIKAHGHSDYALMRQIIDQAERDGSRLQIVTTP